MASRNPLDLHPAVRVLHDKFLANCKACGLNVLVYQTYRSVAEQDALYAQGRTKPGAKVTNAKGGQSLHNYSVSGKPASLAFDAAPLLADGKTINWNASHPDWAKMGEIGQAVGLEWGGAWKSFKDAPHFQRTYASLLVADK